jgi:hypothetical protein
MIDSHDPIGRREMLRRAMLAAGALVAHPLLGSATAPADDRARLASWVRTLRAERLTTQRVPLGRAVARVGELSLGSPYVAGMLDAYAREGGDPRSEPLTLDLSRFDCVLLVEGCLAVARAAHGQGRWSDFAREVERMRYRGGVRNGYASRLHYFSEWIYDNARRGMLRDLGAELGGTRDERPLRFMTEHRSAYPALRDDATFQAIAERERALDSMRRVVIPTDRIAAVQNRIQTGDVLAFATRIAGLDATHTGFAYRDRAGVMRVLHAPLSGGAVEVSRRTLPEYVAAIRNATGIMVARPLRG